jgi:hypothetical protein
MAVFAMRDPAIRGPASAGAAETRPAFFARLFHNRRSQRRLASLRDVDDATLADIGLPREELSWALSVPLTIDPVREVEQSMFRRYLEEARRLRWASAE